MGYAEASQIIHAPIETVWNTLNDIDNTPKWVVGLKHAEIVTVGSFGKGSIYTDYNKLPWTIQVTPWHVTEFEPMTRQVHVSESINLPSTMTLTLQPTDEGTLVKFTVDFRFIPRWGAAGRLFERMVMSKALSGVIQQNLGQLDRFLRHQVGEWAAISHYG